MKHSFINLHRDAATETKGGFSAEEKAQLQESFSKIENALGTKMADKVKSDIEAAFTPFQKEIGELKQYKVDAEKAAIENQKALDDLIAKGQRIEVKATENNLGAALTKAFEDNKDAITGYTKKGRSSIQMEVKVVGNIGSGNFTQSGTAAFNPGPGLWEPGRKPYEMRHIREFLRVVNQPTGMDTYVIRDAGGEGGPTSVAAGAAKPLSDRDWVKTFVPITKIAHHYKIPEEYLADIPWLQDEITGVGVEELLAVEDTKILTNSAGGEFLGLNQTFNSTAYAAPASLAGIFTGTIEANNYDVLVAAWTQLRILKSTPTGILMHPADYAVMILTKDTTGNYVFGAPNQNIPNIFGAPIVPHTAVTSDKFYLGDFTKVKVGQRAGLSVRFYDQNEDDAIKNMVTVVIEERLTMAADRADRVIYGDFSDAQAGLES